MMRTSERTAAHEQVERRKVRSRSFQALLSDSIKRGFDFVAALIGLIFLAPIFALIAILIKRDSPGPVFYWGQRVGRNGTIFRMLKFRTMYETPRSYLGPRVTAQDDDRITPVGKWLRDTKLNELPQLWNVLVGEMSLVGPRPEDPAIAKTWPLHIAREIWRVRPGITSPASVVYRDEERLLAAVEVMRKYLHDLSPDKMRLDQLYVRYRSFWLDLDVILWTFLLLLPKIRSYSPPEHNLFVGPLSKLIERYVSWFLWDSLIAFLSISLTVLVLRLFGPMDIGSPPTIVMALAFSMLFSAAGLVLDINSINWRKATFWASGRLWLSWSVAVVAFLALHVYLGQYSLRVLGTVVASSLLTLAGIFFVRFRGRLLTSLFSRLAAVRPNTRAARERVLIVGSGRTAEHIAWLMDHPTYTGKFHIVGFIDDDLRAQGMKIYGAQVIGRVQDIAEILKQQDVGLIILADNQMAARKFKEFRQITRFSLVRVVVAPDIFGSLGGLDAASRSDTDAGDLDEFQCQHCLARYSVRHSPPVRSAFAITGRNVSVAESPARATGTSRKRSRKAKKSV